MSIEGNAETQTWPEPVFRLGFRADVEGLRAIGILLVVAAHARIPGFSGGFVGVDVFLVLSGYLITGLLVKEVHNKQELNLARFYARRLRRLFPALLFLVVGTCLAAWALLPVDEFAAQLRSAGGAIIWLSNFQFAFENLDYFGFAAESNLFLHTWSLGVEEQFYLVWPVLIGLAMGLWRATTGRVSLGSLPSTLIVVIAITLPLSIYWTYTSPQLGFYMMPSRAWQFASGGLVFLFFGSPGFQPPSETWLSRQTAVGPFLGLAGLALIAAAAVVVSQKRPYPSAWALLPTIGTVFVLMAGSLKPSNLVSGLLSLKPMQWTGQLSYSWYLWHWPVLLFGAIFISSDSMIPRLVLVGISVLLAWISLHFVENPIRRSRWLISRPLQWNGSILVVMILCITGLAKLHTQALDSFFSEDASPYVLARNDLPVIYQMGCDVHFEDASLGLCSFGSEQSSKVVVVAGDSVGLQWFSALHSALQHPDWRIEVITKSACPIIDKPLFYPVLGRVYTECAQWRESLLEHITVLKPQLLIFGSSYEYEINPTDWTEGTRRILSEIQQHVGHTFILQPSPRLDIDGLKCLENRMRFPAWIANAMHCSSMKPKGWYQVAEALGTAALSFPDASIIDLTDRICPDNRCYAELDGQIVFRDHKHLTDSFAASLAPEFEAIFRSFLVQSE